MSHRIVSLALVSAFASPFFTGCSDGHPRVESSLTKTTVKGVVKIKGKPAEGGGEIRFNPSNVERKVAAFTAPIEKDGAYTITTYVGGNEVKFSGPFMKDTPQLALSSRYCELGPGENVVDFDLLGVGDEPGGTMFPQGAMPRGVKKK